MNVRPQINWLPKILLSIESAVIYPIVRIKYRSNHIKLQWENGTLDGRFICHFHYDFILRPINSDRQKKLNNKKIAKEQRNELE